MAYSQIEQSYLNLLADSMLPPPEAAEPSMDGVQLAMGGSGAGKYKTDKTMTDAGMAMMDMGAATVKGAAQGFIGTPGDIEEIARLLLGAAGFDVSENAKLPTTKEVKDWLDKNVGKVGDGKNPYESIGEVLAPGGYGKVLKGAGKVRKGVASAAAASPASINSEEK